MIKEKIQETSPPTGLGREKLEAIIRHAPEIFGVQLFSADMESVDQMAESLLEENSKTVKAPPDIEEIDHHTPDGSARLRELLTAGAINKETARPYEVGCEEIQKLRAYFLNIFSQGKELGNPLEFQTLVEESLKKVVTMGADVNPEQISGLLNSTTIVEDLTYLSSEIAIYGTQESLEDESRYIYNSETNQAVKVIGAEADRLLKMTRLIGLIPLNTIHKLREAKIKVVGASVAASSIHLLAALGAENIEFADPGFFEPSNSPRMPGGNTASYEAIGQSKALALGQELKKLRWYGEYKAHHGPVKLGDEPVKEGEIAIAEFLDDNNTDILIEVVDDPQIKLGLREYVKQNHPNLTTVYIADFGANHPVASISHPLEKGYETFNQSLTPDQQEFLGQLASGDYQADPYQSLRGLNLIVKDDLPVDHQTQLLLTAAGVMPYFSQTPITSRGSAVLTAESILRYLNGEDLSNQNLTLKDTKGIFNELGEEQTRTLNQLLKTLLQY